MPETEQLPRPEPTPDQIAEARVDSMPQEKFDEFMNPSDPDPTAEWSNLHRKAAQIGTIIDHAIWEGTGGRGAHDSESRQRRDKERAKVGLPPKYSN